MGTCSYGTRTQAGDRNHDVWYTGAPGWSKRPGFYPYYNCDTFISYRDAA
eukprot:gene16195-6878_t